MKFLLQSVEGEIEHDFVFACIEALKYQNWLGRGYHHWILRDSIKDAYAGYVPVGSVEFVQEYLEQFHGQTVKPRNVPRELATHEFAGRHIVNGTEKDVPTYKWFAKDTDTIKAPYVIDEKDLKPGNYQFSNYIEFTSEWRAFVWRNELVGLQNYSGDFTQFPSVDRIHAMMLAFNGPCAYTLDVGMYMGDTFVVEVHDFFSCGLYGFSDSILPIMLGGWFNEFLRNNK